MTNFSQFSMIVCRGTYTLYHRPHKPKRKRKYIRWGGCNNGFTFPKNYRLLLLGMSTNKLIHTMQSIKAHTINLIVLMCIRARKLIDNWIQTACNILVQCECSLTKSIRNSAIIGVFGAFGLTPVKRLLTTSQSPFNSGVLSWNNAISSIFRLFRVFFYPFGDWKLSPITLCILYV